MKLTKKIINGDEVYFLNGVKKYSHSKSSNGNEQWIEYDKQGNEIHYKDSDDYEVWREYDKQGNEIHYKNSDGYESWMEYDKQGNQIHYKDSDDYEWWSDDNSKNPKNKEEVVDVEPFKFGK